MKTIYVAAPFSFWPQVREVYTQLRESGWTVTHDWTGEGEPGAGGDADLPRHVRRKHALDDYQAVLSADVVLVITAAAEDKHLGCGCWIELGIALAAKGYYETLGGDRTKEKAIAWLNIEYHDAETGS